MAYDTNSFNNLSDRAKEALFNAINKEVGGENIPTGTPVNAVAASGTVTSTGTNPADAGTLVIGDVTYTFKDTLTGAANEIKIGADAATTLDNLKLAVNAGAGAGTNYGTGTVANPLASATTNTDTTQLIVAATKGTTGNSIVFTESATNTSVDGTGTLASGVDGTIGSANTTVADSSYLYVAIADNTVSDTNWRRISLGSAY